MSLSQRLLLARARGATRRAARERRRSLEAQLGRHASERDRRDLYAILDRYPDGVTHELREILDRQARARESGRYPAVECGRPDPGRRSQG